MYILLYENSRIIRFDFNQESGAERLKVGFAKLNGTEYITRSFANLMGKHALVEKYY